MPLSLQRQKQTKRVPRLTKKSKAIRLLTKRLTTGELTGKEPVSAVWNSEDIFRQHRLPTSRTRYLRLLKEMGISSKNDDEEPNLGRTSTGLPDSSVPRSHRATDGSDNGDSGEESSYDRHSIGGDGSEVLMSGKVFMPFRLLSEWTEPHTTTKRCTVVDHLPSGVSHEDFTIYVVDEGNYLELDVKWPRPLTDLKLMHSKWLKSSLQGQYTTFHPEFLGFESALKELRSHNAEDVHSKARFHLPFVVERKFETYNMIYKDGTKLVYIRLKAHTDSYGCYGRTFNAFEVVEST
ncbi:hypothetical protein FGB62_134g04 [Gracilaria domingensis]|nr:hypothetical protein FGB62_134g04 [Gracilaria domingensis]